jgi:hypothetical protein
MRKTGEKNNGAEAALGGMAVGSLFGPVGLLVGGLTGLFGGLASSESQYESYKEC